jgi:serine/threonine protein kinase
MLGKVTLEVITGSLRGQAFTFAEHDTFIFGRDEDCHARLSGEDSTASRHHFILEVNPPDARIGDLNSLNGTYVNGTKYGGRPGHMTPEEARRKIKHPEVDVKDGDEIKVGETVFIVRVEVPAVCFECGNSITSIDKEACRWDDELYVCPNCREKVKREVFSTKPDGAAMAIKIMLAKVAVDDYARDLFKREIEVTRSLHHPNIVELFDHGSIGNGFWFAMESCVGGSVWDLMQANNGPLSIVEAGPIILQILDGLSHAHQRDFVHRDIKPQNILLTAKDGGIAKLSDFGLAKNFQKAGLSGMTVTGQTAGTFPFMPREQLTNFKRFKPVGDVWSIGATLYYMLTGTTPRDFPPGQSQAEIVMRNEIVPIRNRRTSIPMNVAGVIDRAVAKDAIDRYQTAEEFRDALMKVI